jgi:hypothetical protein
VNVDMLPCGLDRICVSISAPHNNGAIDSMVCEFFIEVTKVVPTAATDNCGAG